MSSRIAWFGIGLVSVFSSAALANAGAREPQRQLSGATPVTLEGFVLAPDGSPAEGAVVVSSGGGHAVTDVAGNYRLEVEMPLGASSVQVTAVGRTGANLVASARVALSGRASTTRVDPLALSLGSGCSPSWVPTFGEQPGVDGFIRAFAVFDDGSGPALYVGGSFVGAGSVQANRIAKWDGSSWTPLGSGTSGIVHALTVYDDGSGPALYAGGDFASAGGVPVSQIAKWDGVSWSALGSASWSGGAVLAMAVFDGGGPALYVGGGFTMVGGVLANKIARWDGSSWTTLGSGIGGSAVVQSLVVHDDGGGPALYAGGSFTSAGGVAASRVAKWNGSSWSALGSGMNSPVLALAAFDDGSGPKLYAGGSFTSAGGVAANRIARWNGSSWSPLGSGMDVDVMALAVHDDGGGPALHAGGDFTSAGGAAASRIARWNGSSWSALGSGMDDSVRGLGTYDAGSGPVLYAGGDFKTAGVPASGIAKWDGSSWSTLRSGLGLNDRVAALAVHDDGGGPALYAGGFFKGAGGATTNYIARWNGSTWSPLGSGVSVVSSAYPPVLALAVHDDGGGPALYAGGNFVSAGGVEAKSIAKWNGSSWSALGSGMNAGILALAVYDDGAGPELYAGGGFTWAGGATANGIAKWDGSTWSALGSGTSTVQALAVYDDGAGPALYVGGPFAWAGGVRVNGIARWDGSSWSALGTGVGGPPSVFLPYVRALVVHDDGTGPALYAGGSFTSAGGVPANRIAKWDGSSWSALGGGVGDADSFVNALASHDDGSGTALYAGGFFTSAGGVAANRLARWDGSSWSALGSGMSGSTSPEVSALIVYDDGGGQALYVGGSFTVTDSLDGYLAKWGESDSTPPVISCPPPIVAPDRQFDGEEVVFFTVTATDDVDPAPAVACVPPSGSTFPLGTTLVTCTATDCSGNQSTCEFPVTVAPKARRR